MTALYVCEHAGGKILKLLGSDARRKDIFSRRICSGYLLQTSPSAKERGEKLLGFNLLHLQKYLIRERK